MKRLLVLVALAVIGAGCGRVTDPLAAEIGDRSITFERVQEGLEGFRSSAQYDSLAEQGDIGAIERDYEQGLLAQLVRRAILTPAAEEAGLEITEAQVDEQIDVIKADFPSDSAFEEALKEQGLDLDALRDLVRDRLLEEGVREAVTGEVAPTEEELRAFYDENIETYRQVEISHILVPDRQTAQEVADELSSVSAQRFESLFARRAEQLSQDQQSAPQGGYLGFAQPDQFVGEFAQAVRDLDIGELSEPVQTEFGYHVIYVSARRTLEFEEVAANIEQQIGGPVRDEAFAEWLRDAYENVWINPRFGEVDPVTGAISDPGAQQVPGAEAPQLEAPAPEGGTEIQAPAP